MAERDAQDKESASKITTLFGQIGCAIALYALFSAIELQNIVPIALFASAVLGVVVLTIRSRSLKISEVQADAHPSSRDAT